MPHNSSFLSVIIPAYNEELVIAPTLHDVISYLKKKFNSFEVIVVDDGSTDNTVAEVKKISGVTLLQNDSNRGKGFSVKRGVLASRGDLILFMDADNSTNILELNHFLDEIRDADIVIGSRALPSSNVIVSQNKLKKLVGRIGNALIKSVLHLRLQDTRCGFKLMKKSILPIFQKQHINRWGFDDEILFLATKAGLRIIESPVTWINNFDSKVKPKDYLKSVIELLKIRLRYHLGKYS